MDTFFYTARAPKYTIVLTVFGWPPQGFLQRETAREDPSDYGILDMAGGSFLDSLMVRCAGNRSKAREGGGGGVGEGEGRGKGRGRGRGVEGKKQ
jgi:hypothetical protein